MPPKKPVPAFPFSLIERNFTLASYYVGGEWCPAVVKRDYGYQIRVEVGRRGDTTTYDYFRCARVDGFIVAAPRGYARDYKPGRITGLDEAVERYATDPNARRFVLPGGVA